MLAYSQNPRNFFLGPGRMRTATIWGARSLVIAALIGFYWLTFDRLLGAEYRRRAEQLNCEYWHLSETAIKETYPTNDISWAKETYHQCHQKYVDCLEDAGRTEHRHRVAAFTVCSTILTLFAYSRITRKGWL